MKSGDVDQKVISRVDGLNQSSWVTAQSDPREALRMAQSAISIADAGGYESGRANGLLNRGWALINTADYDDALKSLHESLDLYQSLNDIDGKLKALNALGVIAHRVGDSDRALERYRETLEISRQTGNRERLLASFNNLGELSASLNHHSDARAYYEEAHEVAREIGSPATMAVVKVNLAAVCLALGQADEARGFADEGIRLAREASDRISESEGVSTLGLIELDSGNHVESRKCQELALALAEKTGDPAGVIAVLVNLGALYSVEGELANAQETLHRASELSEEIGIPMSTLPAYDQLASLYEESGELERSLELRKKIQELQQNVHSERALKRLTAMRVEHELDKSRAEAEIFRLRNVELREKTDQLEAANERLRVIGEIGREIAASLDLGELAELLYNRINGLMEAAVFGIAVYNETERELDYAFFIEEGQRIAPVSRGIDDVDSFGAWAVRNREEVVIADAEKEYTKFVENRSPLTRKLAKSIVYIPLIIEDRVVGVFTVQSHRKRGYTEDQLEVLRTLSSYVAIGLDNSRQLRTIQELNRTVLSEKNELERAYERIAHLANHDNLTELPNRRLLKELLSEHIPLARRQRHRFGLLYLDLDDFKPVNDTFGHAAGDNVLVRVGERLRGTVRSSDTVARIGGDEFVLVVRDIDNRDGLETIAQKVLDSIRLPIPVGDQICTLGASIGVSVFPRDGETVDELLGAADRAMYSVKAHGKFGVRFAESHAQSRDTTNESSITSSSNVN